MLILNEDNYLCHIHADALAGPQNDLDGKLDLLRLGSIVKKEELCSYKFYFNFSGNSSPFSLLCSWGTRLL